MLEFESEVVAFLHTRNRPEFTVRAITLFRKISPCPIIILDASDDNFLERLRRELDTVSLELGMVRLLHHDPQTTLPKRFQAGLEISSSKVIYLMADDDLVLPGFMDLVEHVTTNTNCVAAYGDAFSFEIMEGFRPYGTLGYFRENQPNPEAAWLEDDHVENRLQEIGRRPLSTLGWYAVHRRDSFETLVNVAQSKPCSHLDFEYILNVLQPILGKVNQLPVPTLARQVNRSSYTRISKRITEYQTRSAPLIEVGVELLARRCGLPPLSARTLLINALEMDRLEMEAFRWRQIPVVNSLLGKYPRANALVALFRRRSHSRFTNRDPRFHRTSEESFNLGRDFVLGGVTDVL